MSLCGKRRLCHAVAGDHRVAGQLSLWPNHSLHLTPVNISMRGVHDNN